MLNKELLEKIGKKLKETQAIRNFNSKDFRFKNWHASTINLLKTLPSNFIQDINDFKKLTFIDTKYHRGNRFSNPSYDARYLEDLDSASAILKKIVSEKIEIQPEKEPINKEEVKPVKVSKPKKPSGAKKSGSAKKTGSVTKTKTAGAAKIGKSTSRPKKQSSGKKKKS
ncbi:MAG: hypothetical protein WC549_09490 [Actinomycetota bacterium]